MSRYEDLIQQRNKTKEEITGIDAEIAANEQKDISQLARERTVEATKLRKADQAAKKSQK